MNEMRIDLFEVRGEIVVSIEVDTDMGRKFADFTVSKATRKFDIQCSNALHSINPLENALHDCLDDYLGYDGGSVGTVSHGDMSSWTRERNGYSKRSTMNDPNWI
jgi:hypothetical protein